MRVLTSHIIRGPNFGARGVRARDAGKFFMCASRVSRLGRGARLPGGINIGNESSGPCFVADARRFVAEKATLVARPANCRPFPFFTAVSRGGAMRGGRPAIEGRRDTF